MLHHRHEQIKPQRRSPRHHLRLHRAATLERRAAANDQREVMRAQARVAGGRVGVCEAGGGEDCACV